MMVLPEREVPGIRAKIWNRPTASASRGRISSTLRTFGGTRLCRFSIHKIKKPPTTSAAATLTGVNSTFSMKSLSSRPMAAAGMKAMARLSTKRLDSRSLPIWVSTWVKRVRYSYTTARMAPSWMAMLNTAWLSASKPMRLPATIRWPVLEMGRNSVRPSMMPRKRALKARSRFIGQTLKTWGQCFSGSLYRSTGYLKIDAPL